MSLPKRNLTKPLMLALIIIIAVSVVAIYIVPKFIYVSPFSAFYASGMVDHKKVGYGTINGEPSKTYTVSVVLFNEDPVNGVPSGEALAYIVSEADWNMIAWGDTVKIKVMPNANAEVAELYPTLNPPIWQEPQLNLGVELIADKARYNVGDTVNFTVRLNNPPLPPGDSPYNASVSVFQDLPFFAFTNGKNVFSAGSNSITRSLSLAPSQEVDYSFVWNLTDIPPGTYYVRVYLGYLTANEEATLSGTTMIYVFG